MTGGGPPGTGGDPLSDRSTLTTWPCDSIFPPAETGVGRKMLEEDTVKLPCRTLANEKRPVCGSLLTTVGLSVSYPSTPTRLGLVE